ncbi:MAG: group II intron maturase-specific domain-containing protein, partial [Candidatus Thermoplasmatota archaeon]|nr:group II intron maturase-specific domain-containing protein [Candidatus Thermoplasmatota archaeon]
GNSERKFRQIDNYVREELALWWSKKHHKQGRRWSSGFTEMMYRGCGVQVLSGSVRYWSFKFSNA